jgi:hypothetical protein
MDDLEELAAKLDMLIVDPHATPAYDLFAGGLVWSDERPGLEATVGEDGVPTLLGLGHLRALLNYRSSLILEEPRERFRDLWERARQLCPRWPGFLQGRRDPLLAVVLRTKAETSKYSWEELDAVLEKQRNAETKTTNA